MGMIEVAKATVTIVPTMKGSQATISEELGAAGEKAGDSAGKSTGNKFVSAIKSVIAAAAIGETISSALTQGAALQQSIGGIETLFKDSADKVKEYAEQSYKTTGLSANEYMENVTSFAASLLSGLGGDTEAAAEIANTAMTDMSDNANKMGTDMEAITNAYQGFAKQNYTMLDNLKLGYGGTASEMARLINDSGVLGDTIEVTADTVNDVSFDTIIAAIHEIQNNLDITGTTSKEAASTYSGSLASMKAAGQDLLANLTLGEDIGPSLTALEETVKTFVIGNLLPMVSNLLSQVPGLIAELPAFISEVLPELTPIAADIVSTLAVALVENLPVFLDACLQLLGAVGEALAQVDWASLGSQLIDSLMGAAEESAPAGIALLVAAIAGMVSLGGKVSSFASGLGGLASKISGLGTSSTGATPGVSSAATSFGQLAGQALLLVAAGAAVYLIAQAMQVLVNAAISLAEAGPLAIAVFVGIAAIAVGVTAAIVAIGSAATVSAAGLLAMGAAVLMVSAGVSLIVASLALFCTQLPTVAEYGSSAASGLLDLSGGMASVTAEGVLLAASLAAVTVAATANAVAILATDAAMVVLLAELLLVDAELAIMAAATALVDTQMTSIASSARDAAEDLEEMVTSVDIVDSGLSALKSSAEGVIEDLISLFDSGTDSMTDSAEAFGTNSNRAITSAMQQMSATVTNKLTSINTTFTSASTAISSGIASMGQSAVSSFASAMSQMLSNARSAVNSVKSLFSGTCLSFYQYIALPHFSMSGSFSAQYKKVPSVSVSWYKTGGILTEPTIFGMLGTKYLGGGEDGPEAVLPLDGFYAHLDQIVGNTSQAMTVNVNIARFDNTSGQDVKELAQQVAEEIETQVEKRRAAV